MKYTQTATERAQQELAQRRENAEAEHNRRFDEVSKQLPEIVTLTNSLKNTNFELIKILGKQKGEVHKILAQIRDKNLTTQRTIRELLTACGYTEDYLEYKYHCPVCKDRGYHDGERCECLTKLLKQYTTEELNQNCHIQLHDFSEFRIEFYPEFSDRGMSPRERMRTVYSNCREYADKFHESSPSLFFLGRTGLGKTFLSSCIANELINKGYSVVFGSILKLFRQIEDEHFGRAQGDTMSVIENADLVILDDLGSEFQTSFTDSVLYEIINERINLGRPTIISTNLTKNEYNSRYNERIISRLTGCFSPILFMGEDIRHVKLKNNL